MSRFHGVVTNKVDAKGRVSVPAKFRVAVEAEGTAVIFCYPSLTQENVLEAGGLKLREEMEEMLDRLDPYTDDYEALAHVLVGASTELVLDGEGRISLPVELRHKLGKGATFVGLGRRFQIWPPRDYERFYSKVLSRARKSRHHLRSLHRGVGDAP